MPDRPTAETELPHQVDLGIRTIALSKAVELCARREGTAYSNTVLGTAKSFEHYLRTGETNA